MTPPTTNAPSVPPPSQPPSLSFPAATFAKLSPHPYLLAHLSSSSSSNTKQQQSEQQQQSFRPNGRLCPQFRPPHINTGSLTHAQGSAVVRCGDTTAVAGVRAEILLVRDIAGYRTDAGSSPPISASSSSSGGASSSSSAVATPTPVTAAKAAAAKAKELQDLDLLVPNIELATGCSPQFLPGGGPSTLAQSLSTRVYALLHASRLVDVEDLRIWDATTIPPAAAAEEGDETMMMEQEEEQPEEEELEEEKPTVKAYWTLYIDILFISLDGNPFDVAWAAALAALRDVRLPRAWWDIDAERVLCSDAVAEARRLNLRGVPVASTFGVFAAAGQALDEKRKEDREGREGKRQWILADPDTFEEGLCEESVTVVVDCSRGGSEPGHNGGRHGQERERQGTRILGISKVGGTGVGSGEMRELVGMAEERWMEWAAVL